MRTGFATPARRPWFRRVRGIRRGQACGAVAAIIVLSAITSGCADNSPVSAPTSTLPAPQSSETASSPSVPEYTTDLDLTDEEKEAVEGALVAFDGFISTINSAYSGKFEEADRFPEFASGEALASIETEAESIRSKQAEFEGQISPLSVEVVDVGNETSDQPPSEVVVQFCVDTTQWSLTEAGKKPTPNPDGKVTMQHQIQRTADSWKVDKQSLWERTC